MKKQLQLNSLVILSIYCGTMTSGTFIMGDLQKCLVLSSRDRFESHRLRDAALLSAQVSFQGSFFAHPKKACTSPRNLLHYFWYTSARFVAMAQFVYRDQISWTA